MNLAEGMNEIQKNPVGSFSLVLNWGKDSAWVVGGEGFAK